MIIIEAFIMPFKFMRATLKLEESQMLSATAEKQDLEKVT